MDTELILDSLKVSGFRAFENLEVPKLGRVNLITGKNNVGKTCLLEALQVYARRGEPNVLQSLLVRRDETYVSGNMKVEQQNQFLNDVRHVFHNRPALGDHGWKFEVGSLHDPKQRVALHLETLKEIQHTIFNGEVETEIARYLVIEAGDMKLRAPFAIQTFRDRAPFQVLDNGLKCTFIWTRGLEKSVVTQWWDRIALTEHEEKVIAALQTIMPSVERVTMVSVREGNPERIPLVRIKSRPYPIPMKSLGEGVNRMFGLALALVSSQNGLLMVDEIETGLHYSVQTEMWRLVFKTARQLNVQVFATTHSYDCIRAFEEAGAEDAETEGVLIRLELKNGKVVAAPFDEAELEIAVREEIEVR